MGWIAKLGWTTKVWVILLVALFNPASGFNWTPPVFSKQDSLFIVAATGEPRFKSQRDSCEKVLALDSTTIDYLLTQRLTGQTPRQRHYVEHLFAVISDSGKNLAPVVKLTEALKTSADSLKIQLLQIGSELGDKRFLPVARLYLLADSGEVRRAATRSLGMYPDSVDIPHLLERTEKTSALERQANLWALSRHGAIKEWSRLVPVLGDENLYNRQFARRLLAVAVGHNWKRLERSIPIKLEESEQLEWVLLASELPGTSSRLYLERSLSKLSPDQRKFLAARLP